MSKECHVFIPSSLQNHAINERKNKERRSRSMPLSTKILQPFFCQRKSKGRESGSLEGDLWEEWGVEWKGGRGEVSPLPHPTLLLPLLQALHNPTRTPTLTQSTPPQILKPRAQRAINVMILPHKPPLPPIIQIIELVTPVPIIPPPGQRRFGIVACGLETLCH